MPGESVLGCGGMNIGDDVGAVFRCDAVYSCDIVLGWDGVPEKGATPSCVGVGVNGCDSVPGGTVVGEAAAEKDVAPVRGVPSCKSPDGCTLDEFANASRKCCVTSFGVGRRCNNW